jgi:citrate lyase subunit beta/citryl-CoA lyase
MIPPRRSVLFTPGSNARALEKIRALDCDVAALDLEDAVAPEAKDAGAARSVPWSRGKLSKTRKWWCG